MWLLDAASLAALSLLRMLHLRTASEQLEVESFDEQTAEAPARVTGPLELTEENVELVLDGMRPYLIADGGNVALRDIDGGVVILELQGACGSCPSSSVSRSFPNCL